MEAISVRDAVWASAGYVPHIEQLVIHDDRHRFKLIAGGERSGKSLSAAKELLWRILLFSREMSPALKKYGPTKGLWWIVGPTYELCRQEFAYVMDDLITLGATEKKFISFPKQGQCSITLPFGLIETKSSDDARKLAMVAPDGVIACEVGQLDYYSWLKLFGRAAEKRAWIWASGKFEADVLNWYAQEWTQWQVENPQNGKSFSLPTWSNIHRFPGGRQDPEILQLEAKLPPDLFQEWIAGIPVKPHTLVFPEFDVRKHVVQMQQRPGALRWIDDDGSPLVYLPLDSPTYLAIDPGYAGAYAVLALKMFGDDVYVLDEVYEKQRPDREVISICREREWWPKKESAVMDGYGGSQHNAAQSQVEVWESEARVPIIAQRVDPPDGIARLRSFLAAGPSGRPRIFYSPRCKNAISEYGKYKYRDVKEGRPEREIPIQSDNHAISALYCFLVAHYGYVEHLRETPLWVSPFMDWTGMKKENRSIPWELRD